MSHSALKEPCPKTGYPHQYVDMEPEVKIDYGRSGSHHLIVSTVAQLQFSSGSTHIHHTTDESTQRLRNLLLADL